MLISELALIALLLIVAGGGALIGRSSHLRLRRLASSMLALTDHLVSHSDGRSGSTGSPLLATPAVRRVTE